MRTAGLTMNDVWAGRILRERGAETDRYEGLPAEIGVFMDSIELTHRSKQENYRPYLHLTGELRWLAPAEILPYGISRVTFSPGHGEKVDAFYEFDDQQLVALAGKGYFRSAFAMPEQQITGIEWELPATVDVLVLAPPSTDTGVPVVFTQVHDIAALEIDLASCGYDLTDYVDDAPTRSVPRIAPPARERGRQARSDAVTPLFPDEDLDLSGQAEPTRPPADAAETGAGAMGTRLQQVEADIAAAHVRYRAERERTQGTPENVYRTRVAEPLRTAEGLLAGPRPEHVPAASPGIDLERETHDARPESSTLASTAEERARRAADLNPDLDVSDDGHDLGS